jgi:sugar transferase (PEP-CTERM/EpsH1 system associated)
MSARAERPLILHVVYRFAVGGLENGVVNLINRLPEEAFRHGIVSLTDVSEEFCRRVARQDVIYVALHKGPGHALRLYPRLYRLFRSLKPAIVHTRNLAALEAVVPAWAAGVPVRVHGEHGWGAQDPDGTRTRYRRVRQLFSPFVHRYIALSQHLERYLVDAVGIGKARVLQIYNGVDTERFRPAKEAPVAIQDYPFQNPRLWVVGTVGRMEPVKDTPTLARAFVRALQRSPEAQQRLRLALVGDGPLREATRRVLEDAGVPHLAWMPGERADVAELLRGFHCFALPSRAEGISNTILEAMATGLPVIATRVGGNAELVADDMTGRLVPPADPEALASRILDYFHHPEVARRHGTAGRSRVIRQFSLEQMVARYRETYEALLPARRGERNPAPVSPTPGR